MKQSVTLEDIDGAYRQCLKGKAAGRQAQVYQAHYLDHLFDTHQALHSFCYQPSPMRVFTAENGGKRREIHAPSFYDRVVHHYLVPRLMPFFEPGFIDYSCANRQQKGTHYAVDALQKMARKCSQNRSQGHYLQLDVFNFFYQIDKVILFGLLKKRLDKVRSQNKLSASEHRLYLYLLQQIIFQANHSHHVTTKMDFKSIPAHKQLSQQPANKGIAIGSLTSQFFSNVYLNELDQFIKHQLKVKHYVRYVDDFVLLHSQPDQLALWHRQIELFLQQQLELSLKPDFQLRPIAAGINFLGYIIRPHYKLVRKRVVGNLKRKLKQLYAEIARPLPTGTLLRLNQADTQKLQRTVASYSGHFRHAHSLSLQQKLQQQYSWLYYFFKLSHAQLKPIWQAPLGVGFNDQCLYFQQTYSRYGMRCLIQKGRYFLIDPDPETACSERGYHLKTLNATFMRLRKQRQAYVWIAEIGHQKQGPKKRAVSQIFFN